MLEEQHVGEASNDLNEEINKLIESMSGLHIDHNKTINVCYAQYFQQKFRDFQEIDKLMGLLVESFTSKAKSFTEIKISGDVYKLREEFIFIVKCGLNYILTDGFGLERKSCDNESDRKTEAMKKSTTHDNCDDDDSPTVNVKSSKMAESSKNAESATVIRATSTGECDTIEIPPKIGKSSKTVPCTTSEKATKTGETAKIVLKPPNIGESSNIGLSTAAVKATKTIKSAKIALKSPKIESSKTGIFTTSLKATTGESPKIVLKFLKIGESSKTTSVKATKDAESAKVILKPTKIGDSSNTGLYTAPVKVSKTGKHAKFILKSRNRGESLKTGISTTAVKATKAEESAKIILKPPKRWDFSKTGVSITRVKATKTGESDKIVLKSPKTVESSKTGVSITPVKNTKTGESTKIILKPSKLGESLKTGVSTISAKATKAGESTKIVLKPSKLGESLKTGVSTTAVTKAEESATIVKSPKIGESSKIPGSTTIVQATKTAESATSVQIPNIDKSTTVKSPKVPATVVKSEKMDKFRSENDTVPVDIDGENSYGNVKYYKKCNFPPRLRFKRNLALMTKYELQRDDDSNADEITTKRRRDVHINEL